MPETRRRPRRGSTTSRTGKSIASTWITSSGPNGGFSFLSSRLTALAGAVIRAALDLAYRETTSRHGIPRTVANLTSDYAVFGLGKLGGAALGYASDIEILFVFDDNGQTDGNEKISNAEFYEKTFRAAASLIEAKREGIFEVDLRLRPHGQAGPVAVSLMSFCTYFGPDGEARSYERLALVRLRFIGGNRSLGNQVERLRDEFIYNSRGIDLAELRALREKQLAEKGGDRRPNAKFSPGALVDLEYTVQILQLTYGKPGPAAQDAEDSRSPPEPRRIRRPRRRRGRGDQRGL